MRTSAPGHLYLSLNCPYLSSLQLLYALIGRYNIVRRSQHLVTTHNLTFPPIQLVQPTLGHCEIALHPSTDPHYSDIELHQSTTMSHETLFGKTIPTFSKRCFRIKNGEWSVWSMGPGCSKPGVKLADLVLWEVPSPSQTVRGEMQIVHMSHREDERGGFPMLRGNFMMTFWLGEGACWQMKSQVGYQPHEEEVYVDEYLPMAT